MSRTFSGQGWLWVAPIPRCLPMTLSLKVLTSHPHALLLYSGPLSPTPTQHPPTPMLALQLVEGQPELLVEGKEGPLKLGVNTTLHDGHWHSLHVRISAQGVVLVVDLCGHRWDNKPQGASHCLARKEWHGGGIGNGWLGAEPLQVGGVAHSPLQAEVHGWQEAPTSHNFQGCLSHLIINSQIVDLGEPAFSHNSSSGCVPQEEACRRHVGVCGMRGHCVGGLINPKCECDPGWTGPGCSTATIPVHLGVSSYMKLALSFTPVPQLVMVQVRVRTLGQRDGLLLHLASHHNAATFSIHLQSGVACASVWRAGQTTQTACVEGVQLGDGRWHSIEAARQGHSLRVSVDDGDAWRRNESLILVSDPPLPLHLDKHDGVTVGGLPEFVGVSLIAVHHDLQDTCLDDLRVSGNPLPLSPAMNGTHWGQVTTMEQVNTGCPPLALNPCHNFTCPSPLLCHPEWDQPSCSCGMGRMLQNGRCGDIDECVWRPCLHGGTCHNQHPGYLCICGPGYLGNNCQWSKLIPITHPLVAPTIIAALSVTIFVFVILGVLLSLRLHRIRTTRTGLHRTESGEKVSIRSFKGAEAARVSGDDREGKTEIQSHNTFLEFPRYQSSGLSHIRGEKMESVSTVQVCGDGFGEHKGGGRNPVRGGGGVSVVVLDIRPRPHLATFDPTQILSDDDLRDYAYEGDGSSSGSLTSTISGLHAEVDTEEVPRPLVPAFLEVVDLLRNLPDARTSSFSCAATTTTTRTPIKTHHSYSTTPKKQPQQPP